MSIATNIVQSKHLLELGLSPDSADMTWSASGNMLMVHTSSKRGTKEFPAWSLSALLNVMPKGTELVKMQSDAQGFYYEIDYMYTGYEDKDAIIAAYEMVCWLLEQGLIEKGGQDENPYRHP